MAYKDLVEEAIRKVGGCGAYQWIICVIMHASKLVLTFSTITMAFAGHNPGFVCKSMFIEREEIPDNTAFEDVSAEGLCKIDEAAECNSYYFYTSMSTVVSQWGLVCSHKWIVALITSLQMVGVLFGCLFSSYLADYIGPKRTFFSGQLTVIIFNFVGIYSTYSELYILIRMIIGLGIGLSVTVQFALMIEYVPAKLVPVVSAVPSVSIGACLFAPVVWWLHDWKMFQLFITVAGLPSLILFWCVPDSFRWQMIKYKQATAARTYRMVAWVNRKEKPDVNDLLTEAVSELEDCKNGRNFVDLCKTRYSCGMTSGIFLAWFAVGYTYFGTIFGVGVLQGNLFLNLLLITVIDAPLVALTGPLANWFGRKKYGICTMVVSGVCGIIVGVLQYTYFFEYRLTTVLALICKMTGTSVWIVLMMFTMEIYPSDIRTLAYGFHYTGSLLGGVVAPLVILLNDRIPGLLYLSSGIVMIVSAVCFLFFRECQDISFEEPVLETDEELETLKSTQRLNRSKQWSSSSMEIP